jgi:isopenicillin N synthase-like dioxygenase
MHGMAEPTVPDLHAAMTDVLAFMERHDLPRAATEHVRAAVHEVAAGDAHGAERFLSIMGAKGALDASIAPAPGVPETPEEEARLQREWEQLLSRANDLARTLLDEFRSSRP